jgi:hypothetical protein
VGPACTPHTARRAQPYPQTAPNLTEGCHGPPHQPPGSSTSVRTRPRHRDCRHHRLPRLDRPAWAMLSCPWGSLTPVAESCSGVSPAARASSALGSRRRVMCRSEPGSRCTMSPGWTPAGTTETSWNRAVELCVRNRTGTATDACRRKPAYRRTLGTTRWDRRIHNDSLISRLHFTFGRGLCTAAMRW